MNRVWVLTLFLLGIFSSGDAQFSLTSGYPQGGTWTGTTGGFGNSGNQRNGAASGPSNSCQGPLNSSWTWGGTRPAPQYAILTVTASASWGGSATGTCNDGFSDPVVVSPQPPLTQNSGTSTAVHYVLENVTSGVVTFTVNPTASAAGGGCAVSIAVTVTPISLTLSGGTQVGSAYYLAVGQFLTATVNGMPGDYDDYDIFTWSTPSGGNPYAGYSPTQTSCATPIAFSLPAADSNTLSCYFGKPATVTISCSYWSWTANLTAAFSVTVTVAGPTITNIAEQVGKTNLLVTGPPPADWTSGSPYPTGFRLWDSIWTTYKSGMWEVNTLNDPTFLTSGTGTWGCVQIINLSSYQNGTVLQTLTGLDGNFPYKDANPADLSPTQWSSANGTTARWQIDSPGWPPPTLPSSVTYSRNLNGSFAVFIFYKPPGALTYVPVKEIQWAVKGGFQFTSATTWGPLPPDTTLDTGSAPGTVSNYPDLSSWPIWP